ncbi:MAG: hypothetical protein P0S95_05130 [Rhabdochlamydiaceae bacterium]|nr:hypothetical protein [Candidatus Amphrikana amoebophyrae]
MAERPIECNQCKKLIKVTYKEIKGNEIHTLHVCEDCPVVLKKLHLDGKKKCGMEVTREEEDHLLVCSGCNTTSDAIKMGNYVGCAECYETFGPLIAVQLTKLNKIQEAPKKFTVGSKVSLHKGKHELFTSEKREKLGELNVALDDAVKGENFEQAAWIRDKINILMEETSDEKI